MIDKEKFLKGNPTSRKIYFFFLTAIAIFIADHFFKTIAMKQETENKCLLFCLNATYNRGAAFSLLSNLPWARVLLILVSIVVIALAVFSYFKFVKNSVLLRWALCLIFAGTLSNLLDRIFLGYVVDYIPFFGSNGLTFNLADVSNTVGVALLIIFLIRKRDHDKKK